MPVWFLPSAGFEHRLEQCPSLFRGHGPWLAIVLEHKGEQFGGNMTALVNYMAVYDFLPRAE